MVIVLLLGLQERGWPPPRLCSPEGLLRGAEVRDVTKGRRGLIQGEHQAAYSPGAALTLSRSPGGRKEEQPRKMRPFWEQGKGAGIECAPFLAN